MSNCSDSEQVAKLLLPGKFRMIHGGHAYKIRKARENFTEAHLTVGIIPDASKPSVLSLHEKIETFQHIAGVDQVTVIHLPITRDLLDSLGIDYLVTASLHKYPLEERVVRIENYKRLNSTGIIARVVRDYEAHAVHLVDNGFKSQLLNVSRPRYLVMKLRRTLNQLSRQMHAASVAQAQDLEVRVDRCRFRLQAVVGSWTHQAELALRKWTHSSGTRCKQLYRILKGVLLEEP